MNLNIAPIGITAQVHTNFAHCRNTFFTREVNRRKDYRCNLQLVKMSGSPRADVVQDDSPHQSKSPSSEERERKEKRLREIRAQIEQIKRQIEETDGQQTSKPESRRSRDSEGDDNVCGNDSVASIRQHEDLKISNSPRGSKEARRRQRETIEKVDSFKDKLKKLSKANAGEINLPVLSNPRSSTSSDANAAMDDDLVALDLVDGDSWLAHRFDAKGEPNSDFEDHEEERLSRNQPNKGYSNDDAPQKLHRHDRSRSSSRSQRESKSRASNRERLSSPDHHRHPHRDRHRSSRDKGDDRHSRRHG